MISIIPGQNYSAGIGYVALPVDLPREQYISLCYKTGTVCVRTEDGGFKNRVPISENDLNLIDFPDDVHKLGSPVVYVTEPIKGSWFIVAIYPTPDKVLDGKEHQFKIRRKIQGGYVEISGSAKDKFLGFTVIGDDKPGELYLRVTNKGKNSKLKLEVTGDTEITSTKNTIITSFDSTRIETKDPKDKNQKSSFKQTSTENYFESDNIIIKSGDTVVEVRKDQLVQVTDRFGNVMVADEDGWRIVTPQDVDIVAGENTISMTDAGIQINPGKGNLFLAGGHELLYNKLPGATEILEPSQIGICKKAKGG